MLFLSAYSVTACSLYNLCLRVSHIAQQQNEESKNPKRNYHPPTEEYTTTHFVQPSPERSIFHGTGGFATLLTLYCSTPHAHTQQNHSAPLPNVLFVRTRTRTLFARRTPSSSSSPQAVQTCASLHCARARRHRCECRRRRRCRHRHVWCGAVAAIRPAWRTRGVCHLNK